ncbi:amidase [Yeosuana sp. MJ-SS3]|uniref:Amidase n=1 Tax=Gilvirhabdus luticola TaxID=3079858 RepID=A0ABU3U2C7_9FLAO|nr:amidase [Yeosuana sp. MJ-SS3]MDU8884538.1 amidase [Yeosuana sp. MJ-SS3]
MVGLLAVSCESSKEQSLATVLPIHDEITIDEIQKAYSTEAYSIKALTQFYLDRIENLNFNGPKLNAIITLNPDVLKIATQLDDEMQNGRIRGPLHGIPVLLKDNIDTGDKMPCTAGAIPMKDSYPLQDSPLAAQLREAGAVILGKANLSEWANFHSSYSSSGWSGLGGQTKNPYDVTRNPCGSSSGSGVAVAANLCVVAIGTETNGSIVCPSNNNGIVGIKPTVGLISRRGIIPISFSQDTGGPMARTVKDAAISLGTLTAIDTLDGATLSPGRIAYKDYTQFLNADGIKGKIIGYWKSPLGNHMRMTKVMEEAVSYFKSQGATIVELDSIMDSNAVEFSRTVMYFEFKDGLNTYLKGLGTQRTAKDLEDLIKKTFSDSIEMQYFDRQRMITAQSKESLDSEEYQDALKFMHQMAREEGIDKIMDENHLDAIIAPTGGPAWKTDLINGDNFGIFSSSPAAISGYPNITVPMGNLDGLPVGLSIFGRAWSEPILLEIAYSYEQGTRKRFTPKYLNAE